MKCHHHLAKSLQLQLKFFVTNFGKIKEMEFDRLLHNLFSKNILPLFTNHYEHDPFKTLAQFYQMISLFLPSLSENLGNSR